VPEESVGYIAYIKGFIINAFKEFNYFPAEITQLAISLFLEY